MVAIPSGDVVTTGVVSDAVELADVVEVDVVEVDLVMVEDVEELAAESVEPFPPQPVRAAAAANPMSKYLFTL